MDNCLGSSRPRAALERAANDLLLAHQRPADSDAYPVLTGSQLSKRRRRERLLSSICSASQETLGLPEEGTIGAGSVTTSDAAAAWCSLLSLDDCRSRALVLRSEGATLREIAHELRTSPQSIQRWLRGIGQDLLEYWQAHPDHAPDVAALCSIIGASAASKRRTTRRPAQPHASTGLGAHWAMEIRKVYWAEVNRPRRIKRRHYPIYPPRCPDAPKRESAHTGSR